MSWKLAACSTGIVSLLIACSGADPGPQAQTGTSSATLQASVARGTRGLDNARAVAIRQDGAKYWSYLDGRGAFALALPAGFSYRLLIANTRGSGGLRTIGHFVAVTPNGTTRWVHLAAGQTLALGALHPKAALGGSRTQSEGEGGHADESDGPSETHHDDVDESDDDELHHGLCGEHDGDDDDDVDLEDDVDSAHDDIGDDSVEDHDSEDGDDTPCPPPPPPPPPPSTGGGSTVQVLQLPTGTPSCKVNADCSGTLVCVASKCQFPTPY